MTNWNTEGIGNIDSLKESAGKSHSKVDWNTEKPEVGTAPEPGNKGHTDWNTPQKVDPGSAPGKP